MLIKNAFAPKRFASIRSTHQLLSNLFIMFPNLIKNRELVKVPSSKAARNSVTHTWRTSTQTRFRMGTNPTQGPKSNDFDIACKNPSKTEQKLYGGSSSSWVACECDYSMKTVNCADGDSVCDNVGGFCSQMFDFWLFDS